MRKGLRGHFRQGPATRGALLLLCLVLLWPLPGFGEDPAVEEEEVLLDDGVEWEELDEPESVYDQWAHDLFYHTPNERSPFTCDHENCFWKLNMGEMNEAAIWAVLTAPITVLKGRERTQVKVRALPDKDCTDYTGAVTCASQGVHVLERGDEWTLIEAYSSCTEGSDIKVWALPFQGYVETKLLEEREVDQQYGLVIDKLQQRMYVFKEGHLYATMLCSTGFPRSDTPFNETPAGEFITVSWVGGFWAGKLYCEMGIRINDGILVHQVPRRFDEKKGKWDYTLCEQYLGEKASHGCIRVQKEKTPEGVCAKWLWDNLSRNPPTKVIIWDEIDRELGYPDDGLVLYYNPGDAKGNKKGKNYHSQPTCRLVDSEFEPMQPFTYAELDDEPYAGLGRCPGCAPQLRRREIDTVNEKNDRRAD